MTTYGELEDGLIRGDLETVKLLTNKALDEGAKPRDILVNGLIASMNIVGHRMKSGEMFLPEVLASAGAMHQGLGIIKPLLSEAEKSELGKVVIGTVEGDIHDIGKRIVGLILQGMGFDVIDLGVIIQSEAFAHAIENNNPEILGMSALLTTTAPRMGETIALLKEMGIRDRVKVIIGGAATTDEFAKSIEADGYAADAGSVAQCAKRMFAAQTGVDDKGL